MAAFEGRREAFEAAEVAVMAASTDDAAGARQMVERTGFSWPVGYGLPLEATAAALGAFYEVQRHILHATEFVLRPGGVVAVSCYSSGPIGRLDPEDVLRLVRFYRKQARRR